MKEQSHGDTYNRRGRFCREFFAALEASGVSEEVG
jgi:hypothetical protein